MDIAIVTTVHARGDNRIYFKEMQILHANKLSISLIAPEDWKGLDSKLHYLPVKKVQKRVWRFFYVSFFQVLRNALKIKPRVFHFHDPEIIPAALLLKFFGFKIVYDAHEMFAESLLSKPYLKTTFIKKILSFVLGGFEILASSRFDAIIAARPDVYEKFSNSKNVILLRNFPIIENLDVVTKTLLKEKPVAIYVGGLTSIRGIFELIESFQYISTGELWLLGEFSSQEFEKKCRASKGWSKVRYLGKVPANEVLSYVKQADIGVITFLPEPNHLTTLATKPFEYMACGLPVIMSDFPYWKETFKDNVLYVNPASPILISELIADVFNNPQKFKVYGERGEKLVRSEFNWRTESMKLVNMYNKLLEK